MDRKKFELGFKFIIDVSKIVRNMAFHIWRKIISKLLCMHLSLLDLHWSFLIILDHSLPFQDYKGHVFWDQETWMYPPILFFHADLAKLILDTRVRTSEMAKSFAKSNGRQGMQFPWESAYTGIIDYMNRFL